MHTKQIPANAFMSATMSSEQVLPTSDLRAAAQDTKREADKKHRWAMGATERLGRPAGNSRPVRMSDVYGYDSSLAFHFLLRLTSIPRNHNNHRRRLKSVDAFQNSAKITRKHDMLEGTSTATISDDSSNANSDYDTPSPPADAAVTYSFDAARGPSHGSQILNTALAKAVERFEERETVTLVKNEYDVLDAEGETVISPAKKGKEKAKSVTGQTRVPDADEDYEFV